MHPDASYGARGSIRGGCSDSACVRVPVLHERGTGGYAACDAASYSAFLVVWSSLLCYLSPLFCRERLCEPKEQAHSDESVHSRAFSFMRRNAAFASPALAVGATPRGTKGTIEVILVPTASISHGCLQPSTCLRRRTVAASARRRAVGRPPTWCAARGRAARPRACPAPRSSRRQCAGPTVSAVDCRD